MKSDFLYWWTLRPRGDPGETVHIDALTWTAFIRRQLAVGWTSSQKQLSMAARTGGSGGAAFYALSNLQVPTVPTPTRYIQGRLTMALALPSFPVGELQAAPARFRTLPNGCCSAEKWNQRRTARCTCRGSTPTLLRHIRGFLVRQCYVTGYIRGVIAAFKRDLGYVGYSLSAKLPELKGGHDLSHLFGVRRMKIVAPRPAFMADLEFISEHTHQTYYHLRADRRSQPQFGRGGERSTPKGGVFPGHTQ